MLIPAHVRVCNNSRVSKAVRVPLGLGVCSGLGSMRGATRLPYLTRSRG